MTSIRKEVFINAPANQVWDILSDLGGVVNYHPFVQNSYYSTQKKTDLGAARVCEFPNGMVIEEKATHWNEGQAYTLAIDFIRGQKPPLNNVQATVSVKPSGSGSVASINMQYQPKFGFVGTLMDRMMIRKQYNNMLDGLMTGLKHHAETGEVIEVGFRPQVAAAAA